jgi:hypothetical protein
LKDPERLIDSDLEARELLRAALREEPSAAAAAQLHAALGLEVPSAPLATASAPWLASKWLALATVAVVAGYGAYRVRPAEHAVNSAPPAPRIEQAAPAPEPRSSLTDELRQLDAARESLAKREAVQALRALDAYEARYPHGALREEALALRVETLHTLDRVAARELARSFLRSYPRSVHRARVQAQLDHAR